MKTNVPQTWLRLLLNTADLNNTLNKQQSTGEGPPETESACKCSSIVFIVKKQPSSNWCSSSVMFSFYFYSVFFLVDCRPWKQHWKLSSYGLAFDFIMW